MCCLVDSKGSQKLFRSINLFAWCKLYTHTDYDASYFVIYCCAASKHWQSMPTPSPPLLLLLLFFVLLVLMCVCALFQCTVRIQSCQNRRWNFKWPRLKIELKIELKMELTIFETSSYRAGAPFFLFFLIATLSAAFQLIWTNCISQTNRECARDFAFVANRSYIPKSNRMFIQ